MIIVEGPDGAGKTTILEVIRAYTGWDIAPRVVSKEAKAMADLMVWTERNVAMGFQKKLFDRHRLISDPIYRFALRSKVMQPSLYNFYWLSGMFQKFYEAEPIIIYCLPPLGTVRRNLEGDEDNKVIVGDIDRIYYMYSAHIASQMQRPGLSVYHYDYTTGDEGELLRWIGVQLRQRGITVDV